MAADVRLELLGRIADEDEHGRYRDTPAANMNGSISPIGWRTLERCFRLSKKSSRFSYRHYVRTIFHDYKTALRGDTRPIDRYLDNYLSYTNFDALEQRRSGFHGLNRVVIDATMTAKDNLSVRLWMKALDDKGRWSPAPEWRDIPYYGHAAVMGRPDDEVLFIRDVNRLTVERAAVYERYDKPDPNERKLFEASCELVNAVFWLTVQRLAQRFEVPLADTSSCSGRAERVGFSGWRSATRLTSTREKSREA